MPPLKTRHAQCAAMDLDIEPVREDVAGTWHAGGGGSDTATIEQEKVCNL
jgi:hypothetical protein